MVRSRSPAPGALLSPFVCQRLGTFIAKQNGEDQLVLKELIEAGKVTPVIGKTYPLVTSVGLNLATMPGTGRAGREGVHL